MDDWVGNAVRRHRRGGGFGRRRPDERAGGGCRHAPERADPRFLAEGATGTFFRTKIGLANPDPTQDATAVVTFQRGRRGAGAAARHVAGRPVDGDCRRRRGRPRVRRRVHDRREQPVRRRRTDDDVGYDHRGRFSSGRTPRPPRPRRRRRGSSPRARPSSSSTCSTCCRTRRRPRPSATVRFLLLSGTTITRTYSLGPGSRTTIYVNEIEGLGETDVSGEVPRRARRSWSNGPCTGTWPASRSGSADDSMGVTAASPSWFLAEGATGTFFDLYR